MVVPAQIVEPIGIRSTAGLVIGSAKVFVSPPLSASAASCGSVLRRSEVVMKLQSVSDSTLEPLLVGFAAPPQFEGPGAGAA